VTTTVSAADARAAAWDCSQTVLRLFGAMDALRYADVAAAFTDDGVWHRAGKVLAGRAAIVAAMNERPPDRRVRHVITNIIIDVHDETRASGSCYVTAYAGPLSDEPAVINAPWLVLTATHTFRATADGWKISESTITRDFVFSGQV
jgi:hypothetical protein